MKFNVGDKVRIKSTRYIKEIISIEGNLYCVGRPNSLAKLYKEYELEPVKKDLTTLEVGDVVVEKNGYYHEVLAVVHRNGQKTVYVLIRKNKNGSKYDTIYTSTAQQLEDYGYIIKDQPTQSRTVEDILAELSDEDKEIIKGAMK